MIPCTSITSASLAPSMGINIRKTSKDRFQNESDCNSYGSKLNDSVSRFYSPSFSNVKGTGKSNRNDCCLACFSLSRLSLQVWEENFTKLGASIFRDTKFARSLQIGTEMRLKKRMWILGRSFAS